VVEEDEGADHPPGRVGQDAPDLEAAEVLATLVDDEVDHGGGSCPADRAKLAQAASIASHKASRVLAASTAVRVESAPHASYDSGSPQGSAGAGGADTMEKSATSEGESPSRLIDARIRELGDWRGEKLAHVRALIRQADPEVVEEWKWRGVPVWSDGGIICTGETYKSVVKLTFAKGASLEDPAGLFNSSLDGNTRRAIDIRQDETIDEEALKALVRAAAALNRSRAR
jgi:hypothetical protein